MSKTTLLIALLAGVLPSLDGFSAVQVRGAQPYYSEEIKSPRVTQIIETYFNRWSNNGSDGSFQPSEEQLMDFKSELIQAGLEIPYQSSSEAPTPALWQCLTPNERHAMRCSISIPLGEAVRGSLVAKTEGEYFLTTKHARLVIQKIKLIQH